MLKPCTSGGVVLLAVASSALALVSCASAPRTEFLANADTAECVVLLHGFNRSWRMMRPLAMALHEDGFMTANVDYPSRAGTVDVLVPMAVETGLARCREAGADRIHFVTHSIGAILLRQAYLNQPIPEIGRVVMLAPPNSGSELVDKTRNIPGSDVMAGRALMQLGTDEDSIPAQLGPVDFEVGVVAGTGTINPILSAMLPDEDDGKVTVERTKLEGMTDFLIVEDNHHSIVRSDIVIRNTLAFLRTGDFIEADKSAARVEDY